VKDVNGDVPADFHNILNRWKKYFSLLLNVLNVSDIRQTKVHTAEPLVPGSSCLEVKIAIAQLKKYKSPDRDEIPAEMIQEDIKRRLNSGNACYHSVQNLLSSPLLSPFSPVSEIKGVT
jgi:hypothetical protein